MTFSRSCLQARGLNLSCVRSCVVIAEERPRLALTQSFSKLFKDLGLSPRAVSTAFGSRVNLAICLQVGFANTQSYEDILTQIRLFFFWFCSTKIKNHVIWAAQGDVLNDNNLFMFCKLKNFIFNVLPPRVTRALLDQTPPLSMLTWSPCVTTGKAEDSHKAAQRQPH